MSYLESNLGKEEKIILKAEVSYVPLILSAIIGAMLLILGISIGSAGGFIITLLIAAIIVTPKILSIKATELGLTSKRVMGKYGIINTKVMDSPLNKVNSVTVEQGLGGKMLGCAKIVISTSSGRYKFNYIDNADAFRNAVMEQIDIAEKKSSASRRNSLRGQ